MGPAGRSTLVIGFAVVPLLPKGTLRSGRGLASVVLVRGLVAGGFFAAEAYIPYLLMEKFDFSPTWAGIALMLAAFAWAGGSALQGIYGELLGNRRIAMISMALILAVRERARHYAHGCHVYRHRRGLGPRRRRDGRCTRGLQC